MNLIRSIASRHFPRTVFRDGERLLWNPLSKKTARYRPEERVRLQFLEYLILQSEIPASRISTESIVPGRFSRGRTDILCYNTDFNALLLIECKSEKIKLGSKTATQSAVYNRFIKAPYVLLTNGIHNSLFQVDVSLRPLNLEEYPTFLKLDIPFFDNKPEYWKKRGFLNQSIPESISEPFATRLALLFHFGDITKSYIPITFPADKMSLSHYYALLPAPTHTDTLIALTMKALDDKNALLCAIYNRNNQNIGCLRVFISESGDFHSPELYVADSPELFTPDISELQKAWTNPRFLVSPNEGQVEAPDIESQALCFSNHSSRLFEKIFLDIL
ncbi:MAG: type I restriction enzyme HsdR N-terminal domain-containing protein [Balneolales bacterium]